MFHETLHPFIHIKSFPFWPLVVIIWRSSWAIFHVSGTAFYLTSGIWMSAFRAIGPIWNRKNWCSNCCESNELHFWSECRKKLGLDYIEIQQKIWEFVTSRNSTLCIQNEWKQMEMRHHWIRGIFIQTFDTGSNFRYFLLWLPSSTCFIAMRILRILVWLKTVIPTKTVYGF